MKYVKDGAECRTQELSMLETLRGLWGGIKWTWNYDRDTLPIILQKIPKRTKIKKVKA